MLMSNFNLYVSHVIVNESNMLGSLSEMNCDS